jgi:hypothetical protein
VLSNLVFGGFAGVVAYLYVCDNLGLAHQTGVYAGLLAGVVVSALFWLYSMEYDQASRDMERWERKHRR